MSVATIAGGRYELGERLGVGGMSTVHIAFDTRLERWVAIKLLAEHLADDAIFVSRFRREALAAARLVHPNIVQVFDFGLDDPSGRHYIVMEYVQGRSCAEILRDEGHLPVAETLDVILQACRGLDHAHRNGVVHRDVKPGNLLRSDDGVVKLADFGIAKATEQTGITQVGSVLGTAAYLAPEQARGEGAGPLSDIYALGVVTYQLLAGRLPYEATSLTELAALQQQPPPPLDELNHHVSVALAQAVEIAIELDPYDRYADALAMADALVDAERGIAPERYRAGGSGAPTRLIEQAPNDDRTLVASAPRGTGTRPRSTATSPRRAGAPTRGRGASGAAPPRQRRSPIAAVLVGLLIVLVIVAAVLLTGGGGSGNSSATRVRLNPVVYNDLQQSISALKTLITNNTH